MSFYTEKSSAPTLTAPPRPVAAYAPGWTDRIPEELKRCEQWVVWRYEFREGKGRSGKWTKVPYQALRLGKGLVRPQAKTNDPGTWRSFRAALDIYQANAGRTDRGRLDGIGFVFSPDDELFGVDFDNCITGDGELLEWAAEWLRRLGPTYAEVSPSGRGIKAIYRGQLPAKGVKQTTGRRRGGYGPAGDGVIEAYDRERYFTITGDAWGEDHPADSPARESGRTNDRPGLAIRFLVGLLAVKPTPLGVVEAGAREFGLSMPVVLDAAAKLEVIRTLVDGEEIWDLEEGGNRP